MIRKLFLIAGLLALSPFVFACPESEAASKDVSCCEATESRPINTAYESDQGKKIEVSVPAPVISAESDYGSAYWRSRADKPAVNSRLINESRIAE